jgi:adenine phosphoribosyltransferase
VGGQVVAVLAVFTEGTPRQDVIALGHLPLFKPE